MPKVKRWRPADDFQDYMEVLEEVYGVYVHFRFDPKGTSSPATQRLVLYAYWKDDQAAPAGPIAHGDYEVALYPDEKVTKTLIRAVIVFTYELLEAKMAALVPRDFRRSG